MSDEVVTQLVPRTGVLRRVQDCEDVVERNKQLQNERQDIRNGWHHLADIPLVILEKWLNEDGVSYREAMSADGMERIIKKKLRDPDWAWLRATDRKF